MASKRIPVVVTTKHRGVFFGYADPASISDPASITLKKCRCAIYWTSDTGGFLGLASKGPASGSRIGAEAPEVLIHDITSVAKASDEAVTKWASS